MRITLKMNRDSQNLGNYEVNLKFLLDNNLIEKNDKILEIGSGKGHMLNTLKRRGFNMLGVEISQDFINQAIDEYGDMLPLKKIVDESLPFKEKVFDKVLSFDVLEHIPNTDSHLQEVRRVLKGDGEYCFGIPNRLTDEPFCLVTYKNFDYKKPGDHCSLHTYWQIKRRLIKNGFICTFFNINQDSDWIRSKVAYHFGKLGLKIFNFINIDKFPIWLKPTLYVVARKK